MVFQHCDRYPSTINLPHRWRGSVQDLQRQVRKECALRAGFIGRRLCPHLVFVPPTFAKYTAAAAATRAVFARFDPDYEAGSLDEAYLDVTEYCRTHELSGAPGLAAATTCSSVQPDNGARCRFLPALALNVETAQIWRGSCCAMTECTTDMLVCKSPTGPSTQQYHNTDVSLPWGCQNHKYGAA